MNATAVAEKRRQFILANTSAVSPPHVPEIRLHLAHEAHELWSSTEAELARIGVPPPFWAFAWAGGQGLARYILDHREAFAGKRVLDSATGSGLAGIAAALAGAVNVVANDIDVLSAGAVCINARLNNVEIGFDPRDLTDMPAETGRFDVVLAGDVFYDLALAARATRFLAMFRDAGRTVLIGDPGRAYLPETGFEQIAQYRVPVSRALEDSEIKKTTVWRLAG